MYMVCTFSFLGKKPQTIFTISLALSPPTLSFSCRYKTQAPTHFNGINAWCIVPLLIAVFQVVNISFESSRSTSEELLLDIEEKDYIISNIFYLYTFL